MIRVAVLGASGYIGGELLRILLGHPHVEVGAAASARLAGRRVDSAHPNLRSVCDLTFTHPDDLGAHDVLFAAIPHLESMRQAEALLERGRVLIDLTADFRLPDAATFERYYGVPHEARDLLGEFVFGLPETHRKELRDADRISVPGCMATAAILALHPAAEAGLLEPAVSVDARTGSSGSGRSSGLADSHSERSGALRVFAPSGHRHEAEITQETGLDVTMSATGIEAVRGVQVLCRGRLRGPVDEARLRETYRRCYGDEPFTRVVARRRGAYRLPEPKILSGSNFCDVGFVTGPVPGGGTTLHAPRNGEDGQALLVGALDNLVKGGAGNAVQCMNIRFGWPERTGLEFPGLHPI
ncbi:N-acetyl-gamma-glutamyl-phosphate reductase [Actinomadura graeca]|uniref:N-acetyl-gamma-glutamyl-phosphate reductase n=1 Tax=Actinomadura graeca TaxID=2750812 RepID=A0ABX8QXE6_9ACTN|nr:N-acetyl-gamma-glutamyl-phosphate reductase [Actinomadura graeca]QXJ22402.1 N-acetyl-gamma-glutamyl-phosphate reductase [Actinomadura graeca]